MPCRSRTTKSSAFLSAAKWAQALARFSAVILRLPVKLALADNLFDRRRYEITNGLAARNPVSDVGGRNVDVSPDRRIRVRGLQAAAIKHGEPNHFRKLG